MVLVEDSSGNESSVSAQGTSPSGSLESASGSWLFAPGLHCKSMPYSISLSAHRWSLGGRVWLLNVHVSAEQAVMRTNFFPHRYGRWCLIDHNTAMTSQSVADHLASAFNHRWLAYPITHATPRTSYVSVAATLNSLVSMCT